MLIISYKGKIAFYKNKLKSKKLCNNLLKINLSVFLWTFDNTVYKSHSSDQDNKQSNQNHN
jgi:hypothetical protein